MQPLKQAIPRAVAELVRAAPLSPGKIDFAWGLSVGPSLQRNTSVKLEGSRLVVETSSQQWSDAVRRSSRIIMARLRAMLGEGTVEALDIRSR